MKQAERIVKQGEQTLIDLAYTYRKCWEAACRYDGFDSNTVFASFSSVNSYPIYLHRLFKQSQEELAAFHVWGCVGLHITTR